MGASKDDRFYGPTNQYKRVASLFGDGILESGRRQLLDAYISQDADYPAYSYHFATNTPGTPPPLGVYHASEIAFGKPPPSKARLVDANHLNMA